MEATFQRGIVFKYRMTLVTATTNRKKKTLVAIFFNGAASVGPPLPTTSQRCQVEKRKKTDFHSTIRYFSNSFVSIVEFVFSPFFLLFWCRGAGLVSKEEPVRVVFSLLPQTRFSSLSPFILLLFVVDSCLTNQRLSFVFGLLGLHFRPRPLFVLFSSAVGGGCFFFSLLSWFWFGFFLSLSLSFHSRFGSFFFFFHFCTRKMRNGKQNTHAMTRSRFFARFFSFFRLSLFFSFGFFFDFFRLISGPAPSAEPRPPRPFDTATTTPQKYSAIYLRKRQPRAFQNEPIIATLKKKSFTTQKKNEAATTTEEEEKERRSRF